MAVTHSCTLHRSNDWSYLALPAEPPHCVLVCVSRFDMLQQTFVDAGENPVQGRREFGLQRCSVCTGSISPLEMMACHESTMLRCIRFSILGLMWRD